MKVVVNKSEIIKEKPFPKLMIYKSCDLIILAYKEKAECIFGVVISPGDSGYKYCHLSDEWGKSFFEDFDGSITLCNDEIDE